MTENDTSPLMTVKEAGRFLNVSRTTIWRLIRAQQLETRMIGKRRQILKASLLRMVEGEAA